MILQDFGELFMLNQSNFRSLVNKYQVVMNMHDSENLSRERFECTFQVCENEKN